MDDSVSINQLARIIGGIILTIIVLSVVFLVVEHDVFFPQIRKNVVDDPHTTIANRKDFHNKLSEILSADNSAITYLNTLTTIDRSDPLYAQTVTNLEGVESIRATAINNYNANAGNPDLSKDMEPWMPHTLASDAVPGDHQAAIDFLQKEITTLNAILAKDRKDGVS